MIIKRLRHQERLWHSESTKENNGYPYKGREAQILPASPSHLGPQTAVTTGHMSMAQQWCPTGSCVTWLTRKAALCHPDKGTWAGALQHRLVRQSPTEGQRKTCGCLLGGRIKKGWHTSQPLRRRLQSLAQKYQSKSLASFFAFFIPSTFEATLSKPWPHPQYSDFWISQDLENQRT